MHGIRIILHIIRINFTTNMVNFIGLILFVLVLCQKYVCFSTRLEISRMRYFNFIWILKCVILPVILNVTSLPMVVTLILLDFVALSNMSIIKTTLKLGGFIVIKYTNDNIQAQIR